MSNVNFAIVFANVDGFPAGSAVDQLVLSISGPEASTQSLPANASTATVTINTAGDYSATVQAVDATGAHLGVAASATFSIAAPATVTLSLPSALSASVAP